MRSERTDRQHLQLPPAEAASEREEDEIKAVILDALWKRSLPDAQVYGTYPEPLAGEMEPLAQPGDRDIIKQRLQLFAFNQHIRSRVRLDPTLLEIVTASLEPGGQSPIWEISRDALRRMMVEAKERYSGDLAFLCCYFHEEPLNGLVLVNQKAKTE